MEDGLGAGDVLDLNTLQKLVLILVLVEDGLGEQLLEVSVNETAVTIFLISLTFGGQKYVPFRVLSQMQIYEFSVSANMFSENILKVVAVNSSIAG